MKSSADRIKNLAETLSALLEREAGERGDLIASLNELLRTIQGDTADRRLQRVAAQLRQLQERLELLDQMARRDFLSKIQHEAEELSSSWADSRMAAVLDALVGAQPPSFKLFCETLLDRLIEALGAERGFILYYLPDSTEADVVAARNFHTTNLSLEEYDFSRSVLREAFRRGTPLLLKDALCDPAYAAQSSVRKFRLRSVLVVPLKYERRTVGALYLENNTVAGAFTEEDRLLLEKVARFVVFYLHHARLLPAVFEQENRVFFDAQQVSKEIVGRHPKILSVLEVVTRVVDSPAIVMIEGESGTGKELVARALHYQSARRERPFVAINCAAIPADLLESELFGHEKGAFTGATEKYVGLIEQASMGTLFLDEISELAYPLQAKLLRFLQSNEFHRLGGKDVSRVDVRVVTGTSKDLRALAGAGKFQEALYYRLNVIPVRLPALRERREDIPLLVEHFLDKFAPLYGRRVRVEREVYEHLREYPFPGNVRELENLIHRLVALARDDLIRVGDLPAELLNLSDRRVSLEKEQLAPALHTVPADMEELRRRREEIRQLFAEQERQLIERTIAEAGGNLTEAARRLGLHRITLHKILRNARGLVADDVLADDAPTDD
jgi:transcriptional regulator with GAF, ATPase, and Fis domain